MFAYTTAGGERKMERLLVDGELQAGVALGKAKLESNEVDANDAVLLYDGRIRLADEKIDAILIEIRAYFSPGSQAMLAVPYTPRGSGRFRVHKPKLLRWHDCDDFDVNDALLVFFEGVAEHAQGAALWNESLDESK